MRTTLVAVLLATAALAADHPQDAAKLVLKQHPTGNGRLVWVSKAPVAVLPAMPPTSVGGEFTATGIDQSTTTGLPPANWTPNGAGTLFKFINREAPGGASLCRVVVIKAAQILKVVCGDTLIVLNDAAQGTVQVKLTVGDDAYCSVCAAPTKDEAGRFIARGCAAPPSCDGVPPTTTTTSTLPGVCGDGVVNQASEQCDGADLGQCAAGFLCGAPGFSNGCRCCADGGFGVQLVGCCNPSSILIPAPSTSGSCVPTRCDPPFTCGGNQCQADGTCCAPPGGDCIFTLGTFNIPLVPCCPGLECRGPSAVGVGCCVPDSGTCSNDTDCCTTHCEPSGTCEACRSGGAACTTPFECCSLSCNTSGTCDACAPDGAPCLSSAACCSSTCDPSTFSCVP